MARITEDAALISPGPGDALAAAFLALSMFWVAAYRKYVGDVP